MVCRIGLMREIYIISKLPQQKTQVCSSDGYCCELGMFIVGIILNNSNRYGVFLKLIFLVIFLHILIEALLEDSEPPLWNIMHFLLAVIQLSSSAKSQWFHTCSFLFRTITFHDDASHNKDQDHRAKSTFDVCFMRWIFHRCNHNHRMFAFV